jgi:hypothetical protein
MLSFKNNYTLHYIIQVSCVIEIMWGYIIYKLKDKIMPPFFYKGFQLSLFYANSFVSLSIALKLCKLITDYHLHFQARGHNSVMDFDKITTLTQLKYSVSPTTPLINCTFWIIALKLCTIFIDLHPHIQARTSNTWACLTDSSLAWNIELRRF